MNDFPPRPDVPGRVDWRGGTPDSAFQPGFLPGDLIDGKPFDGPPVEDGKCPTPDCPGDARYAAPSRGHLASCHYPFPPDE